jgi:hypothetical protein
MKLARMPFSLQFLEPAFLLFDIKLDENMDKMATPKKVTFSPEQK